MAEREVENMMRKLKVLEAKRELYYAEITKLLELSSKRDERSRRIFVLQMRTIDKERDEFMSLMDDINTTQLEINPDSKVNFQPLASYNEMYRILKDVASSLLERESNQAATTATPHSRFEQIKIPRIELPMFDGEIQNFPYFYETFKRVIHDNNTLSDSERIHYLISHLSGKAKSVCAGIVPSSENYGITWQALIDKYKDDRALATSYLNQLFSFKPITSPSPVNLEKFIDSFSASIAALKQIKIDNLSDFIFVYMGLKLVDSDTAKCYETSIRGLNEMPKYDEFIKFIREQVKILYRTTSSQHVKNSANSSLTTASANRSNSARAYSAPPRAFVATQLASATSRPCKFCNNNTHIHLYACKQFLNLSPMEKFKFVKENRCCVNCLSSQHTSYYCNSATSCRKCDSKHHTLLHFGNDTTPTQSSTAAVAVNMEENIVEVLDTLEIEEEPIIETNDGDQTREEVSFCSLSAAKDKFGPTTTQVLATAKVYATSYDGRDVAIRCLLDPGSQKHYITAKCCSKLGLKIQNNAAVTVKGIGGASQVVKGEVKLAFRSQFDNHKFNIQALVLKQITSELPTCVIDTNVIQNFKDITMADDTWATPGEVDLLLGVNLFAEMLRPGKITGVSGCPNALETVLGYVVLGDATVSSHRHAATSVSYHAVTTSEINTQVQKMWELDEIDHKHFVSADDKVCEEFYKQTVTRDPSGRYEVALPFKFSPDLLGNSLDIAKRRLQLLERKFTLQPVLKEAYDGVVRDYLKQEYLTSVAIDQANTDVQSYYIPHHAVLREDKATSKVRPVLDASAKSSSGFSLNDLLHSGPNLQRDLFTILLNMRLFPIAITADIRQMYLRIGVRQQDRCFQRILYKLEDKDRDRSFSEDPIEIFEFSRVTFGLKCSPFLALRTVNQLLQDEGHRFPTAKVIVERDLYMDDIASSIMTPEQAIIASKELIDLFKAGGFDLVKWSTNSREVLKQIPENYRLSQNVDFDKDDTLKILGLIWNPYDDIFVFKVNLEDRPCSKRIILSCVARLFDVLGLVAPIILYAKLLIKELWCLKLGWDDNPPQRITRLWNQFQRELPRIQEMKFPRHLGVENGCSVSLLGFADASEKAYGGAVYIHVTSQQGQFLSFALICAKSKVAPLKVVSLARLELCASLLLSKLLRKVLNAYSSRYTIDSVMAFSDSTVALSWIHSSPHKWNTFVANRVSMIHDNISADHFYHIKGSENPSDCLSRGLTPAQLVDHPLWKHGPSWVNLPKIQWPIEPFISNNSKDIPELKSISLPSVDTTEETFLYKLAKKYSSWTKFLNVATYVFKFLRKLPYGSIVPSDLVYTERKIIQAVQQAHFNEDIKEIKQKGICTSSIRKLNPFIRDEVLRVGGRLVHSDETYEYKHPVLLPGRDYIVEMIVRSYHKKYLHTGCGLLTSVLRSKYWIISARRIIRSIISKCNICFKFKPQPNPPMMADLPEPRVKATCKAFTHTGCDYAGPIQVTPYRGRGIRSRKAYICLFTCLTTRAVHIELASDLSTACFLAALKRFLARRGPVQCFYTDNGSNFIGARSYLREMYDFLENEFCPIWKKELLESRIQWKMIPPHSPHFGGCWESNIKVVKTHLFKVIGQQILTFEEMQTVLSQIESLLNSRPLTLLSSDPSDPVALTPAHFLNTTPLNHLPASDVSDSNTHLISRYELLDKLVQSFWKRWRREYLHNLQVRQKWNSPTSSIEKGMVVVVIQDNVPPLHWPMGVIVETFKGRDNIIRVTLVKTKHGTYQRPVIKLCPLPVQ